MNRDALHLLEQRLQSLLPTTGLAERAMWLCAQQHTKRFASYLERAEQATFPSSVTMHEAWAEQEAAAANAYTHSIEIMRAAR
jgi:hypothetical protein